MRRQSNRSVWALKWDKMVTGKSEYTELFFVLFFFLFWQNCVHFKLFAKESKQDSTLWGKIKVKVSVTQSFQTLQPQGRAPLSMRFSRQEYRSG